MDVSVFFCGVSCPQYVSNSLEKIFPGIKLRTNDESFTSMGSGMHIKFFDGKTYQPNSKDWKASALFEIIKVFP